MATQLDPRRGAGHGSATGPEMSLSGVPQWLSAALAIVAAIAAAGTLFLPGVLAGTAAMNGSARGTALVVLVVAVPALALAMPWAARGSARAVIVWLGATMYLLYNSILFLFATPFNVLFLAYVAMLALSLWAAGAVLWRLDVAALARRFTPALPVRGLAIYTWAVVALNALAWLRGVVPGMFAQGTPGFMAGTGLPTSPVYVQDLAIWLPLAAVAAAWTWRRRTWGYVVTGTMLTFWVFESLSIAIDQSFGYTADPTSPAVSPTLIPGFAALALIGLVPLFFFHRNLDRRD
jgi:hypothetical protein